MIQRLHHIALNVKNADASKKFFLTVFGLTEIERLTGGPGAKNGAWLKMGEIELHLQERNADSPKTDQHFALVVEDLEKIKELAELNGGRIEPGKLLPGFAKRGFLFDLDSNRIELIELS